MSLKDLGHRRGVGRPRKLQPIGLLSESCADVEEQMLSVKILAAIVGLLVVYLFYAVINPDRF
jgi:K+-transporting ATPase KdpF subunit